MNIDWNIINNLPQRGEQLQGMAPGSIAEVCAVCNTIITRFKDGRLEGTSIDAMNCWTIEPSKAIENECIGRNCPVVRICLERG